MKEEKLTNEEIIKSLECCSKGCRDKSCFGSEMDGIADCTNILTKNALDLIHSLQGKVAEYERKFADGEVCSMDYHEEQMSALNCEREEYKAQIERLTEELKNLDWYKMWHKKFKKEIDDLTLELETYRPTKLNGNGQCKCSNCGCVGWTDWFSRYKGQTLCDKCLKEIISKEEKQDEKDTAKEFAELICKQLWNRGKTADGKTFEYGDLTSIDVWEIAKERYGVEVK